MHQLVVLKNNIKIYINIYIKTAPYTLVFIKNLIYAATPPQY